MDYVPKSKNNQRAEGYGCCPTSPWNLGPFATSISIISRYCSDAAHPNYSGKRALPSGVSAPDVMGCHRLVTLLTGVLVGCQVGR